MNSTKTIVIWSVVVIVVIGTFVALVVSNEAAPAKYNTFAQCLTDKGTKMYGASWCPHCKNEKAKFGKSFKLVNYVECSDDSGKQLPVCDEAGIKSYPTWEFGSGKRIAGETTFEQLSTESGCPLVTDEPPAPATK